MGMLERRLRPRDTIVSYLGWLQRLGEPIELKALPDEYAHNYVPRLRTDIEQFIEIELEKGGETLEWFDEWQIIGCFIS